MAGSPKVHLSPGDRQLVASTLRDSHEVRVGGTGATW